MSTKNNLRVEHAVLTFRNFSGEEKRDRNTGQIMNEAGKRNFCVYLDGFDRKGNAFEDPEMIPQYKYGPDWMNPNDLIDALTRDGWIIKWTKEDLEHGYVARPYIKVNIKYSDLYPQFNPKVVMVKSDGGLTPIDEESVHQVDTMWVDNADLVIKPNNYEERQGIENGKVSAQLKTLYVTPVEDSFEDDFDGKYEQRN